KLVERFAPGLDEGAKHALTSLTFNAGPGWMNDGLGQAIQQGDLEKARSIFLQYNKADGEVLPGLVKRRLVEASWFGKGTPSIESSAMASSNGKLVGSNAAVSDPSNPARTNIPIGVDLHTSDRVSNKVAEWIVWSHIDAPDLLKAENKDKADRNLT
ncbi:MAG: lysozyme, partial [Hyphomicrobiaceae bacterium]